MGFVPTRLFLPVKVLSRVFRGKFLERLRDAFDRRELSFFGALQGLAEPKAFDEWLRSAKKGDWVVYVQPPMGGPQHVLKYLARYTHRTAISNQRLISLEKGKVTFRWKDYRHGGRMRTMTLDAVEFIRRFLLHVLPKGFMRIRQYGFLANRLRQEKLARCRSLLDEHDNDRVERTETRREADQDGLRDEPADVCSECKKGLMVLVERIEPVSARCTGRVGFQPFDTS